MAQVVENSPADNHRSWNSMILGNGIERTYLLL